MPKQTIFIVAIAALATACLLPVVLDIFVFGNDIPSNISNGEWASFLGGYIGAIVGAAISLIGICATIVHTKNENKKDRELQVRPHLQFKFQPREEYSQTRMVVGRLMYDCKPIDIEGIGWDKDGGAYGLVLIKNVGMGPAINFKLSNGPIDDEREHSIVLACTADRACDVNSLSPGEEGSIPIAIRCNFDLIPKDAILGEEPYKGVHPSYMQKYKSHDIALRIAYEDILGHRFAHKVNLFVQIGLIETPKGIWRHNAEIHLMNVEKTD